MISGFSVINQPLETKNNVSVNNWVNFPTNNQTTINFQGCKNKMNMN